MGLDLLKKLLDDRLVSLDEELKKEEKRIQDIAKVQDVVRRIEDDPYILYTSNGEELVKFLGLDSTKIETFRKIYEGYLVYGRSAIPQISLVEEETVVIKKDLESKICFLSDVIAKHQGNVLLCKGYKALSLQVLNEESYITQIDVLIDLLNSSNLTIEEKNDIKRHINARNIMVQKSLMANDIKEEVVDDSEASLVVSDNANKIAELSAQLDSIFGVEALTHLKTIAELLNDCDSVGDIENLLAGWQYSFGDSYSQIVDGVIILKSIEILELKDAFGEENEEILEEVAMLDEQITILSDYKNSIEMEKNADCIDTSVGMNEYERAIFEYNPDPFSYPVRVFFLNNAVGRDIDSIKDKETLQDLFLLLENLKKGNAQPKNLTDVGVKSLKPSKRGRQARIRYVPLEDNVCVIVQVMEKKADNSRADKKTLSLRVKEVNDLERRMVKDSTVIEDLSDVTMVHSDKLMSLITKTSTNKIGGTNV